LGKSYQANMQLALNLSRNNIGLTASNPSVGAVLVQNNSIIATGITGGNGIPHAETIAILKAGKKAAGATLYVTLEPCSHLGKTPPCVDLIIKSGIIKVVIAAVDPDLRVDGTGIKKLREAGIEVVVGILEREAKELNRGFFMAKTQGRPFITLKLATSLDGKIADKNGQENNGSKWITSEKSREYAHYLRAKNDAILVGAGTVSKDDPMLDCRLPGLEKYSPKRIVLSSKLDINLNSQVIQTAQKIPTFIATNNPATKQFSDLGIGIIQFDNLNNLVKKLPELGINNLLIEGGSNVATQFLQENLVDRLIWIQAPKAIGEDGISAVNNNLNIEQIADNFKFKIVKTRKIEEDLLTELRKN
jgi:diaminohydroxyphosphoribosylaminopyrimidine deaminase/5-amino-6-(5-phosphoribosylamino)uracil reductase